MSAPKQWRVTYQWRGRPKVGGEFVSLAAAQREAARLSQRGYLNVEVIAQ